MPGNGAAPARWIEVSTMPLMLLRAKGHNMQNKLVISPFVDDMDLMECAANRNVPPTVVVQ